MHMKTALVVGLALFAFMVTGCADRQTDSSWDGEYPIRIVATTNIVAEAVKAIGRDRVHVQPLMPAGTDPHTYQPSPGDVQALDAAHAIAYNGHFLEGKMTDVLARMADRKPTLAIAERLPTSRLLAVTEAATDQVYDPHAWFDVSLWAQVGDPIAQWLAEIDPFNADFYRQNAADMRRELDEFDRRVRDIIAELPRERRILITAHDAFAYFGRAYGFEVYGIQGLSTESESGLKEINDLVDLIVQRQVPAVFVEASVSEKNVLSLIEGARRRGSEVRLGGELFSDSMGAPGTNEGTYKGMILHNVRTIVGALRG